MITTTLSFTLYEVLGYLLPGIPGLLCAILIWTFCHPSWTYTVSVKYPTAVWVWLAFGSYVLGHMFEAVANVLYGDYWESIPWNRIAPRGISPRRPQNRWHRYLAVIQTVLDYEPLDVVAGDRNYMLGWERALEKARGYARSKLEWQDQQDFPRNWLFQQCGDPLAKVEKESKKEIFAYREGFYKGMSLSLFVLMLALTIRAFVAGKIYILPTWQLMTRDFFYGAALCLAGCSLCWLRAIRIRKSRAASILVGFVVSHADGSNGQARGQGAAG